MNFLYMYQMNINTFFTVTANYAFTIGASAGTQYNSAVGMWVMVAPAFGITTTSSVRPTTKSPPAPAACVGTNALRRIPNNLR